MGKGVIGFAPICPKVSTKNLTRFKKHLTPLKKLDGHFIRKLVKIHLKKLYTRIYIIIIMKASMETYSAVDDGDGFYMGVNKYDENWPRKYPWAKTVFTFHNRIGKPYMWIYTDAEKNIQIQYIAKHTRKVIVSVLAKLMMGVDCMLMLALAG